MSAAPRPYNVPSTNSPPNGSRVQAEPGTTLEAGDVVVLRGTAEEVARAENDLLA